MAGPLRVGGARGGGGLNGCATMERRTFFNVRKKGPTATKPRGGAKGLSGRATKKRTFFAASLRKDEKALTAAAAEVTKIIKEVIPTKI